MSVPAGARRGRGRPPRAAAQDGTPAARERILDSARTEFAKRGYDKTSIRAIARGAQVDPALVHHYFGTKERVFSAAVAQAAAPATNALIGEQPIDIEAFGERFTRIFFRIWENPVTRSPLLAIVRSAVNHEAAARIFRDFVATQLLSRVAGGIPGPDARLRAELAAAQLIGCVLLRYVMKAEPVASADPEDLIRRLAPVVQHHLTGTPLDGPQDRPG
ncbi:TetR/AcrR family transcriptional regulator [Streptomyces sp. 6N223]|uniref:TetR/AcrR family transcriptional regulator n=1 Tax=Streptomyces sp. 6N223 TaxID=3457412 RepID=UPI003FD1A9EF